MYLCSFGFIVLLAFASVGFDCTFHGIAVGCGLFFIAVSASLSLIRIVAIIFACTAVLIVDIVASTLCIGADSVCASAIVARTAVIDFCPSAPTAGL